MSIVEKLQKLESLDRLIRMKSTGTPHQLAERMNLSERQLRRYIEEMRIMGAEIRYNDYLKSYEYLKPMKFYFGFTNEDMKKIMGGNFHDGHYMSVTDFTFSAVTRNYTGNPVIC
ncbi:MAG: hypothetical protein RBR35_07205 [Salinivirgaceae bacterium]|nr:hypothetical protein [Salinivirgaceae bacterium]